MNKLDSGARTSNSTFDRSGLSALQAKTDLTSGGHNTGVVSELGYRGRTYQIRTRHAGESYVDPETWQAETPVQQGSWWPEWHAWLDRHSTGRASPPPMGGPEKGYAPRRDAPGLYVRQP